MFDYISSFSLNSNNKFSINIPLYIISHRATHFGNNGIINAFREKSDFDGDLINIGYMVFEPALFDYIEGDSTIFEKEPLTKLVEDGQLAGYVHKGFWQCMDTLREKQKLEKLWEDGNAPWKIWKD